MGWRSRVPGIWHAALSRADRRLRLLLLAAAQGLAGDQGQALRLPALPLRRCRRSAARAEQFPAGRERRCLSFRRNDPLVLAARVLVCMSGCVWSGIAFPDCRKAAEDKVVDRIDPRIWYAVA